MSLFFWTVLVLICHLLSYFYCFRLFKSSVISQVHNINWKKEWRNWGGEQRGISEPCINAKYYPTGLDTFSKDLIPKGGNEISSFIIDIYSMIKKFLLSKLGAHFRTLQNSSGYFIAQCSKLRYLNFPLVHPDWREAGQKVQVPVHESSNSYWKYKNTGHYYVRTQAAIRWRLSVVCSRRHLK